MCPVHDKRGLDVGYFDCVSEVRKQAGPLHTLDSAVGSRAYQMSRLNMRIETSLMLGTK